MRLDNSHSHNSLLPGSEDPTMRGSKMKRAVFLDRDGTVIEEKDYLHRIEEVVVLPGAAAALRRLQSAGFRLIFVTNQSGVGRGYFTLAEVEAVHGHLLRELAGQGVVIDRVYVAPEAPDQPSRGRKPSPQFLFDARDEFGLGLDECYMVGDKLIDLACGWNAGVRKSLLVRTGYGAAEEKKHREQLNESVVVDDLAGAAEWILADCRFFSPRVGSDCDD
jgi:D-glycero-D-manno-heptose 1,7-bisphosphate phosphatase